MTEHNGDWSSPSSDEVEDGHPDQPISPVAGIVACFALGLVCVVITFATYDPGAQHGGPVPLIYAGMAAVFAVAGMVIWRRARRKSTPTAE